MRSVIETLEMDREKNRHIVSLKTEATQRPVLTFEHMKNQVLLRRGYIESADKMLSAIEELRRFPIDRAEGIVLDDSTHPSPLVSANVKGELLREVLCSGVKAMVERMEGDVMDILRRCGMADGEELKGGE